MSEQEQGEKVFVGTCQHWIPEEWYESDDSSYTILDEASGAYVNVTTCEECYKDNLENGIVVDQSDIPMDDFSNPFEDDPAPKTMKVINPDGTTSVVDIENADVLTLDQLDEYLKS